MGRLIQVSEPEALPERVALTVGEAMEMCPKCHGQRHVWTPPYVPGDQPVYVASAISWYPCDVCSGRGIIGPIRVTDTELDQRVGEVLANLEYMAELTEKVRGGRGDSLRAIVRRSRLLLEPLLAASPSAIGETMDFEYDRTPAGILAWLEEGGYSCVLTFDGGKRAFVRDEDDDYPWRRVPVAAVRKLIADGKIAIWRSFGEDLAARGVGDYRPTPWVEEWYRQHPSAVEVWKHHGTTDSGERAGGIAGAGGAHGRRGGALDGLLAPQ